MGFLIIAAFPLRGQHFDVNANNKPLNEVLITLQHQYDFQLSFNDALLSDCNITDSVSYPSLEMAIKALTAQCNVAYKVIDGVFIIYKNSETKVSKTYRFSGKVLDMDNKEGLPYIQLEIENSRFLTDQNGNFSYQSSDSIIPFKSKYIGYRYLDTILTAGLQQTIIMQPAIIALDEVVINGRTTKVDSTNTKFTFTAETPTTPSTGVIKLNHHLVSLLPGNNSNTIFNLLRLQPGVLATGEQTNDYSIWGSQKGQTQILYDGITVFNIGSYNDNVGAINPLMVKDIEVLKAGYNVHIGDRVGGVVNITGKSGNAQKLSGNIQLNQLISSGNINIPINNKYTLQGAARVSYYDFFPTPSVIDSESSQFNFYNTTNSFRDYNFKFSGKEKNGDQYYISTLNSNDEQTATIEDINNRDRVTRNQTANREQGGIAAFYSKAWKYAGVTNTTVAYSTLKTITNTTFQENERPQKPTTPPPPNTNEVNGIDEFSIKTTHTLPVKNRNQIQLGAGFIKNSATLETEKRRPYNETNTRFNLSAKDNISLTKRLNIEPGVRVDYLLDVNKPFFQPRIKANYKLHKKITLNASTGIYNQFIFENLVRSQDGNVLSQWIIANDSTIHVMKSWHHIAGVSTVIKGVQIKIEGFYKPTYGITRIINERQNQHQIVEGESKSYGADFYVEKKLKQHSVWASYTYSISQEKFNDSVGFQPSAQDQRHEVKGAALLNFHPIAISTNYVFGSGLPNIEPGKSPTDILTTYNRWDIAIAYKFNTSNTKVETGISAVNVLNTENIRYNDFLNRSDGKTIYSRATPFTISLFLNIGF